MTAERLNRSCELDAKTGVCLTHNGCPWVDSQCHAKRAFELGRAKSVARIAELEAALKPFADLFSTIGYPTECPEIASDIRPAAANLDDYRRAAETMKGKT